MEETKIESICVDTLTSIQIEQLMREQKKPGYDQWRDYGTEIYTFILDLQALGFELILILGEPGTGKSSGMRTLDTKSNIWYNADKKNPVWKGGKQEYGTKNAPIKPYHVMPSSYADIISHIKEGIEKGMFADEKYAFITGHLENFKSGLDSMQRLKVLGKMATKMQLEGKLESVLYSTVTKESGDTKYQLETQNNGFNTARSYQDMFPDKIDNDYKYILDKIKEY